MATFTVVKEHEKHLHIWSSTIRLWVF